MHAISFSENAVNRITFGHIISLRSDGVIRITEKKKKRCETTSLFYCFDLLHDTFCAVPYACVVSAVKAGDDYAGLGSRCVYEFTVTKVDADVRNAAA